MADPMPAIFFGHGNPMNALQNNAWTEGWAAIGNGMQKPKAILCVSAHWYLPATLVTAQERPRTLHDLKNERANSSSLAITTLLSLMRL